VTPSLHDTILVGDSRPMRRLRSLIETVSPTRLAVLIEGATGTGKELIAALVHQQSGRTGSFVAFNVCALGESMFEDSLFGHAKGAYTGAIGESLGFLREANGGTAFLDEISGLPLALQAKLLRAVETGVFRPIGAARDARSDFRIVTATNERLERLVEQGRFRADLRHRLSGVVITVPTLAERADDIPLLARHFVRRAAGRDVPIDPAAMALLAELPWPGNVRELKQVIDTAVAFSRTVIDRAAVQAALAHRTGDAGVRTAAEDPSDRRELITVLQGADWDVARAASQLGVHRATFYRRMKRHGIEAPRFAPIRANSHVPIATRAISLM
jgi:two-component system response regulator GlrR